MYIYIEVDTLSYQWLCDFVNFPHRSWFTLSWFDDSPLFPSLLLCSHLLKHWEMCPVPAYGHFVSSIFESEIKTNKTKCNDLCHALYKPPSNDTISLRPNWTDLPPSQPQFSVYWRGGLFKTYSRTPPHSHLVNTATLFWSTQKLTQSFFFLCKEPLMIRPPC